MVALLCCISNSKQKTFNNSLNILNDIDRSPIKLIGKLKVLLLLSHSFFQKHLFVCSACLEHWSKQNIWLKTLPYLPLFLGLNYKDSLITKSHVFVTCA